MQFENQLGIDKMVIPHGRRYIDESDELEMFI